MGPWRGQAPRGGGGCLWHHMMSAHKQGFRTADVEESNVYPFSISIEIVWLLRKDHHTLSDKKKIVKQAAYQ